MLNAVIAIGGRLFAVGSTTSQGAGGSDAVLLEIDPATGDTLSTTTFGGAQDDLANAVATDGTDLYVVGGSRSFASAEGNNVGQSDIMLLRYSIHLQRGPAPTTLSFTAGSATTSDFNDAARVQAQLTTTGGVPVPNETVTFTLGSGSGAPTCSATTDATGTATCLITPNQAAGPVTLIATFAGDAAFGGSGASTTFTVTKEETTLKFTASSPTMLANGQSATFSATLKEDGTTPISGRSVMITLGNGTGAQSCTGTTDSSGTASCTIVANQPLGPNAVVANFSGDAFYRPSSDKEAVVVFAFLSSGSFVIGDLNAGVGNAVTFWGAQWAKSNSLSGGPAPNSFKGFADTAPQSCGGSWTSDPGNSSKPPDTVPSYMAVIASSSVTKTGPTISGNVPKIVIVQTNPGYGPAPGHTGTGTVVAVLCSNVL